MQYRIYSPRPRYASATPLINEGGKGVAQYKLTTLSKNKFGKPEFLSLLLGTIML